jgi:hypothetical protein
MAYSDFSLDILVHQYRLHLTQADIFATVAPHPVTPWLMDTLERSRPLAIVSEKARSEFIVGPILLTLRDLREHIAIYSGQRLEGDATTGLTGECDFIIAHGEQLPIFSAPVLTVIEERCRIRIRSMCRPDDGGTTLER